LIGPNDSFDSLTDQVNNSGVMDYLEGSESLLWNPKDQTSVILPKLVTFRDINIAGAQQNKILNDICVL
jgi:hypothetical protein